MLPTVVAPPPSFTVSFQCCRWKWNSEWKSHFHRTFNRICYSWKWNLFWYFFSFCFIISIILYLSLCSSSTRTFRYRCGCCCCCCCGGLRCTHILTIASEARFIAAYQRYFCVGSLEIAASFYFNSIVLVITKIAPTPIPLYFPFAFH